MDTIKLTPRLCAVAQMALGGRAYADIGTDHGYVAVYLAQRGAESVTAADLRPGPLDSARASAREYGVSDRIRFVLADGLCYEGAESADTVVIAGMGGETIQLILSRAAWTKSARLVLQPQTKIDELCVWLRDNGYALRGAKLARDAGRLYAALSVRGGNDGFAWCEDALSASGDPLLGEWIRHRISVLSAAIAGKASAREACDDAVERDTLERLETFCKG